MRAIYIRLHTLGGRIWMTLKIAKSFADISRSVLARCRARARPLLLTIQTHARLPLLKRARVASARDLSTPAKPSLSIYIACARTRDPSVNNIFSANRFRWRVRECERNRHGIYIYVKFVTATQRGVAVCSRGSSCLVFQPVMEGFKGKNLSLTLRKVHFTPIITQI